MPTFGPHLLACCRIAHEVARRKGKKLGFSDPELNLVNTVCPSFLHHILLAFLLIFNVREPPL